MPRKSAFQIDDCLKNSCTRNVRNIMDFPNVESMAPFIYATVTDEGKNTTITVGNESSPYTTVKNSASIKSMEYGFSSGVGCKIEIVDEDSSDNSAFGNFFKKIVHSKDTARYSLEVKWGWVGSTCDDAPFFMQTAHRHQFALYKVNIHFDGGVNRFLLEGYDMGPSHFQSRGNKVYGTSDNPMPLKQAIRELLQDSCPPTKVQFLRRICGQSGAEEWHFKDFPDDNGPKDAWAAGSASPLDTIAAWISPFLTDQNKGVTVAWDDTGFTSDGSTGEPGYIIWENAESHDVPTCDERNIGTYIVNGGKCGSVLSFQPEIMWYLAPLTRTGGHIDPNTSKLLRQDEETDTEGDPCNYGSITTLTVPDSAHRNFGRDSASIRARRADREHALANRQYDFAQPITAQLKIVGDPSHDSPIQLYGATMGIVVINPFHITQKEDTNDKCPEWLAASTCNCVLSSKEWRIMGAFHSIQDGSYTTTFKILLPPSKLDCAPDSMKATN